VLSDDIEDKLEEWAMLWLKRFKPFTNFFRSLNIIGYEIEEYYDKLFGDAIMCPVPLTWPRPPSSPLSGLRRRELPHLRGVIHSVPTGLGLRPPTFTVFHSGERSVTLAGLGL